MRLSLYRFAPVTIALLMAVGILLVACDSGGNAPAAPTATTGTAQQATPAGATTPAGGATAASATAPAGGATPAGATTPTGGTATGSGGAPLNASISGSIDFWHFWGSRSRRTAIRRVIAICQEKLPNIKVTETFKPFGDIWTANTAAVAAGSGMPDVIVEDRPKLGQAAANKIESSLQKYATRDGITGAAFWPFTWQQTLYNNETYGIPFSTDVRVLYWNKNAFKEVGLDPEKPPKTWDELEQYADKLDKKNASGGYDRIGFHPLINGDWDLWSYTNGATLTNEDGSKVTASDPKVAETLAWIKKWSDRYGGYDNLKKFRGTFTSPPNDAFMSGKVAMIVDINGYASQLTFFRPKYKAADGSSVDLDWGMGDMPYKTQESSISGGFALSIPQGSKNQDAAWEFIKCATGPEAQVSWARDVADVPANLQAAKDPVLMADDNWKLAINAMSYSQGGHFVKAYPNWGEQVGKLTEDVYRGKIDPQAALDKAQQAIDAEIAKNK